MYIYVYIYICIIYSTIGHVIATRHCMFCILEIIAIQLGVNWVGIIYIYIYIYIYITT